MKTDDTQVKPATSAQSEPQVHSSAWLAAAEMLQTISSSGYSAEYERGWNAAVRHNRYVLKCAGGDALACAALGKYPKAANDQAHLPPDSGGGAQKEQSK